MNLTSTPESFLTGSVSCPGDKSISQRVLMISSLINEPIKIKGFLDGEDPLSTMHALNQMGAEIEIHPKNVIQVKKSLTGFVEPIDPLDLGNSGTGLRLMLGMIAGLGIKTTFKGDNSLSQRPMSRVLDPLSAMGADITSNNGMLPIALNKSVLDDDFVYELPVASAQVKSCILLAGLAAQKTVTIIEPIQTRDHTERMLKNFGANITTAQKDSKNIICLAGKASLKAMDYQVVGDISSAAFLIVGALISQSEKLEICDVGMNPSRIGVLNVLRDMGARIEVKNAREESGEPIADLIVLPSKLSGVILDGSIIPNIIDEIPILSIAAAFAEGNTIIRDAAELRVKESDRLSAISNGLAKLGVVHENFDDGIKIQGNPGLLDIPRPVQIDSSHDHRIAMSFLIAGLNCNQPITVLECDNIFTSFPTFLELTASLGYDIEK
ncbi:3-phosphoshikimate 1-carboxyvinyltransferase [Gammaproteobacteria bacterium]|nr:3-phosphoshikimate 1-carboxyvinyltransferase [Gammaproteobacteria bacterium]